MVARWQPSPPFPSPPWYGARPPPPCGCGVVVSGCGCGCGVLVCGSGVLVCVAGSIQLYASICCIHRPAFSFNVDSFFLGL